MPLADFRSLFMEDPKRTWRSGLGQSGGSWRAQAVDDAMDDSRFGAFQQAWRNGASDADLFGDNPFELKGSVGAGNSVNRRADVAKVETFLDRTGHYKPLKDGPSGYVSNSLDEAIRGFQTDNGLDADGILNPGGPTISTLASAVGEGRNASGMVHVQAYEQGRDGKTVHVSDYERRRPGTGSGASSAGGREEPASLLRLADSGAVMNDAVPEKQPPDLHPHVTLEFDGHELRAIEDGEVVRRWPAVSGRPGFQGPEHQGEKDKGPLPEGYWILRQSERQDIKNLSTWERVKSALGKGKWRGLENSWGNTRVWLEPGEGTDTKGRRDFSVHGGTDPGSAGCIDLTSHMDDFADYFSGLGKDVSIRVRYPE